MMRTVATTLAALMLLIAGAASAQTVFDARDDMKSVRDYRKFLEGKLQKLYSAEKRERNDTFTMLKASAAGPIRDGDTVFAWLPLEQFVMAVKAPAGKNKPNESLQGDALDLLVDYAKDSKGTVTARETALESLARIATTDKLVDDGWYKQAVKALVDAADSKDFLLVHAAMVGLGRVAIKTGKPWRDFADMAAKAMVARLGDKDPMIQRIAFFECLRVADNAKEFNDATERVWDKLTAYLGDITSPALQGDVKARYSAVVASRAGSAWRKQADAAMKALDKMESLRKLSRDPLVDNVVTVRENDDPVKVESALDKIIEHTKNDRSLQLLVASALNSAASQPEMTAYKLMAIGNAMTEITRRTGSPLMFYRTASTLLGLAAVHKEQTKASVPLVVLARLLASTDQPALVIPVLDEVRDMALTDLPAWLDSRIIALLFLQAADSPVEPIAQRAFQNLGQVGQDSKNWAMRYEVLTRMELLEKHSKTAGIQALAAKWN